MTTTNKNKYLNIKIKLIAIFDIYPGAECNFQFGISEKLSFCKYSLSDNPVLHKEFRIRRKFR
ncbi:16260_t:CDS:2 [Cetraspora pellucida]|uniref:16260_t:CDS:1 n=1 Tax=Cetraspora pellucida TaxID=1433469 RepID=A0A9N9D8P2_9GLOM|nr:16260_t:CDS:2 [Cetraspora pellucida]